MTISNDDLARLARDVHAAHAHARPNDVLTAVRGVALADAVLARDAEATAKKLAHHRTMLDLHRRTIDRLLLANRTEHADA